MNFKDVVRHPGEFNQLFGHNQDLYSLCILLDSYCRIEFKKEITITSIFRTQAEHDALYAQTNPKPAASPHMKWNAVDIRSKDFTDAQIQKMLRLLNCFSNDNGKPVAIYHTIAGNAPHFHIQLLRNK